MNFEQTVELLEKNTKDPYVLARHAEDISSGARNLADRFQLVEKTRRDDLDRISKIESLTAEEREWVTSIAKDRTTLQQGLAALEARVDALEKHKNIDTPSAPVPSKTVAQRLGLSPSPASPATPPA